MMTIKNNKISLIIVGSEKSGTTSLFRLLADHPEIYTHEQSEMTYFRTGEFINGWQYALDKYFAGGKADKVLIAKDVLSMYSNQALQRIYRHNPHTKVVIMLRNPVDRAYSAYWYSRSRGREPLKSFEKALHAEKSRLQQDVTKWLPNAYSGNGLYIRYLQDIIGVFGIDGVYICFLEQLKKDSTGLCQKIFRMIGVDSRYEPSATSWKNKSTAAKSESMARLIRRLLKSQGIVKKQLLRIIPFNKAVKIRHLLYRMNEKPFIPPPMNADTRETLRCFYQQENAELSVLTGNEIPSNWK